jgi:hypothetical protein
MRTRRTRPASVATWNAMPHGEPMTSTSTSPRLSFAADAAAT